MTSSKWNQIKVAHRVMGKVIIWLLLLQQFEIVRTYCFAAPRILWPAVFGPRHFVFHLNTLPRLLEEITLHTTRWQWSDFVIQNGKLSDSELWIYALLIENMSVQCLKSCLASAANECESLSDVQTSWCCDYDTRICAGDRRERRF